LHLGLNVAQVVLDSTGADKRSWEFNVLFTILGVHTKGSLVWLWALLQELEVTETVETVTDLLIDLDWVVTIGQDIQK
jgi:hypothetical protein